MLNKEQIKFMHEVATLVLEDTPHDPMAKIILRLIKHIEEIKSPDVLASGPKKTST